jgi:hypothetical protein
VESGLKYRIVYQIPGLHRVPRQGVVMFLGAEKDTVGRTVYMFSGRPEFGTTEILAEHVSEKIEVPAETRCYMDRKVK